jgi:CheY-like chemotaxis protein
MLLLVDDDPKFLQAAETGLEPGRGIFFARNAEHAKELMRSVGSAFSVAIIDLNLPGQNGFELIRELHEQFPDLPMIAVSGTCHHDAWRAPGFSAPWIRCASRSAPNGTPPSRAPAGWRRSANAFPSASPAAQR